jgi:protein-disulfide isomerase
MPRPDASQKLAATAPSSGPNRTTIGVVVVAVVALAVGLAVWLGSRSSPSGTSTSAGSGSSAASSVPKGATGFGGPLVVNPSAAANVPTVDLFEDPQCPVCKQFETLYGPAIAALVKDNTAKLVVHTMTFLDGNLKNDSSMRAANAAFCAADQGKFRDYMVATYAGQPAKEGAGYTDADLASFAQAVGLSGSTLDTWKSCQASLPYRAHIAALETASEKSGVTGTPTVQVNGTSLTLTGKPEELTQAVQAATK